MKPPPLTDKQLCTLATKLARRFGDDVSQQVIQGMLSGAVGVHFYLKEAKHLAAAERVHMRRYIPASQCGFKVNDIMYAVEDTADYKERRRK